MQFEYKIVNSQLAELIRSKLPNITTPCSYCGTRAQRNVTGVHWMSMDADFAYLIGPRPGTALGRFADKAEASGRPIQVKVSDTPPDGPDVVQGEAMFIGPAVRDRPGYEPCAVIQCSACGNTWLLSLRILGIFQTTPRPEPPALKLIHGGADADDVADPKKPST